MPTPNASSLKVLYVVYWGAAEPLGQSLVLPAVKMLAESGAALTLVTFEKPDDLSNEALMSQLRSSLAARNIRWIPLRYHKNPKIIFDIVQGVFTSLWIGLRLRPQVLHARTFVGGLIGLIVAPLVRTRWVFHNEGFFPDEQVDGGVWKKESLLHRVFRSLEQRMYARANGIIALSHRAKSVIEMLPAVRRKNTPITVVPSCVDLVEFTPDPVAQPDKGGLLRLIYIGSVGRRYRLDQISRFVTVVAQECGPLHLQVLSQTEKEQVVAMLKAGGLSESSWSCSRVPHAEIPQHLVRHQVGLFFLTQGLSEHGCSPTKIGEYWACGLPVITTPNVSDTDEIIRRERVGVVVRAQTEDAYREAARELKELLRDPELATRCRQAAEKYYALAPACERQLQLYNDVQLHQVMERVSSFSESLKRSSKTTE